MVSAGWTFTAMLSGGRTVDALRHRRITEDAPSSISSARRVEADLALGSNDAPYAIEPEVIALAGDPKQLVKLSALGMFNGDDLAVGVRVDGVLDGGGQRCDLCDESSQHGDERAHALALGLGLELAGGADDCSTQALHQLRGGTPAAVRVPGQERG